MSRQFDPATLDALRFRRQFIMGPALANVFPAWQHLPLAPELSIAAHPDLPVHHLARGRRWLTLLGYALDPLAPTASDGDILEHLMDRFTSFEALTAATDRLGGRWAVVAHDGTRTLVFTDAVGMRQLHYARRDATWCASQAPLLAQVVGLGPDPQAVAFTKNERYAADPYAWLPGDRTLYEGARLLLPNHWLDLGTGEPRRYWPDRDWSPLSLDDAAESCTSMLSGLMDAARRRFKMCFGVTAGWDSRLLLAATRPMASEIFYFTGIFWDMDAEHMDSATPTRLLRRLGLENRLVVCHGAVDPGFQGVFDSNVATPHANYAPIAQAFFEHLPPGRVCVKGDVAEVAKCYLRLPGRSGRVSAGDLAKLAGMDADPLAIQSFEQWLGGARARGIHLLDLFCWEQPLGVLEALIEAECDTAHETFSPFNCRSLLVTMLRVDEAHRRPPAFPLFRAIIERLWPEVLAEPINGEAQLGPKALVRRAVRRTGVHRRVPVWAKELGKRLLFP